MAASLVGLGDIRLARGDAAAAEASYRDALAIWQQLAGDDRLAAATALRGLAAALLAEGQLDAARGFAARALAVQRRGLRPMHPAIADTLAVVGAIAGAGSPASAEPALREALAIRRAALAADHPYIARAESDLGDCLARQHRLAEALPLLQRAATTLRVRLGPDHPATRRAWDRWQAAAPDTCSDGAANASTIPARSQPARDPTAPPPARAIGHPPPNARHLDGSCGI